jgi:hypothetical protein
MQLTREDWHRALEDSSSGELLEPVGHHLGVSQSSQQSE